MEDTKNIDLKAIIAHQKETDKKLEALSKENKELRGLTSEKGTKRLKEITERRAELRMIDDRIVIGFKNRGTERRPRYIYEKPDPLNPSTRVNFVDLILEGTENKKEEIMPIKHDEFLDESERVSAKIINVKEVPWLIKQGSTRRKEVDGYSLVELDFVVDLEVKGVTRNYTLRLPEEFGGREVTVYEDYLNI